MPFKSREKWREFNRRRNAVTAAALNAIKSQPCADCGTRFPPYVMQFDHVPSRGAKRATISELCGNRSVSAPSVQAELAKCDVVCANCHAARTYFRRVEERQ